MSEAMQFQLPAPGQIRGAQLVAEIEAAIAIEIPAYSYHPPSTLELPAAVVGEHAAAIQAVVDAHVPAAPVPAKTSTWRIRAVADLHGLTAPIEAAIDALPEPERTLAWNGWRHSFELNRDALLLGALGPTLGLTEAQIDDLFREAAALPA